MPRRFEQFKDNRRRFRKDFKDWLELQREPFKAFKALVAQGFPPERLFAAGFGEHQPKYPNDSEEHRSLNRRVEIGVTPLQMTEKK